MSIYLGTTRKKLPYTKAYLGSTLVYQKASQEIHFNSSLAPTGWTEVTKGTEYTASNGYGTWNIRASGFNAEYIVSMAFDGKNNTAWHSQPMSSATDTHNIEIDTPINIKPTEVVVIGQYLGTTSSKPKLLGYNINTNEWEEILTLDRFDSSVTTKTYSISTDNYYSKFKLESVRYSPTFKTIYVHEFEITKGYYKIN